VAILALALVVLIVVAVVVAVTGSSTTTSRAASPPANLGPSAPGNTIPTTIPPTTIPVPQSTDPDANVLQRLAVEQSDVPAADTAGLIQDGNLLSQPTLDVCNGTYDSEPLRTARLQTAVADADGNTLFSSEAVLYNNANGTAEAFTELRSVAAHCPSTPVQSPVGEPTVTTTFNAAPDGSWPQTATVERLAFSFVTTDQQANSSTSIAVYLRRGRVLLGLYFPDPNTPPTIGGVSTIPGVVSLFASRMAALPNSVITANVPPSNAN